MMDSTVAVLVVGAGPVGLTLALALDRLGVRVRVVDRAAHTKHEARAAVLWPRAVEVLDDLALGRRFVEAANALHGVQVYASGRRLGALDLGHVDSAYRFPLVIEQHDTERLLVEALAERGVPVQWRTELTDLRGHDDHVEAVLRGADGRQRVVEAAWVVGCEGTRSRVRDAAGIAYEGRRRPDLQVLQINADARWRYRGDRDHGWFFLEPHASLGVFAIPGGGYRFFCFTVDPDPSVTAPPTVAGMSRLVARLARTEVDLTPTEPHWVNRARFADRVAATLRHGRVLLAGDAAHAWAPIGGHGMNVGMRGAHNLAWKLAAVHGGQARDTLLDTYDTEQRAAARAVMAEMRFNVLELPLPTPAYWPVAALLPVALAARPVRRRVERTLSDLDMHHRDSPLSVDTAAGPGLRAGDRVPDAPVVGDGRRTTVHALLAYDRWTLLAEPSADLAAIRRVTDRYRTPVKVTPVSADGPAAAAALGRTGTIRLVRPDRHVGLHARADDLETLDAYCAGRFEPGRP
jgi:2-polyprenyl-6-methoxyphenol hydroxylase-like FAD-dependent oxidoreductase